MNLLRRWGLLALLSVPLGLAPAAVSAETPASSSAGTAPNRTYTSGSDYTPYGSMGTAGYLGTFGNNGTGPAGLGNRGTDARVIPNFAAQSGSANDNIRPNSLNYAPNGSVSGITYGSIRGTSYRDDSYTATSVDAKTNWNWLGWLGLLGLLGLFNRNRGAEKRK